MGASPVAVGSTASESRFGTTTPAAPSSTTIRWGRPTAPTRQRRQPEATSSSTSSPEFFEFRAREKTGTGGTGLLVFRPRERLGRLRVHEPTSRAQRARVVIRSLGVAHLPAVLDEIDVGLV